MTAPSCHGKPGSGADQLEQFCNVVQGNLELQEQLRAVPDTDDFIVRVIGMGQEHGFTFNADDIRAAMRATSRAFNARSLIT